MINPHTPIIKGYIRDMVYDFYNQQSIPVPKSLIEYIYDKRSDNIEYNSFIKEHHLTEKNNLTNTWSSYSTITNCSLFYAPKTNVSLLNDVFSYLLINSLEIIFDLKNTRLIINILDKFKNSFLKNIELTLLTELDESELIQIFSKSIVNKITIINQNKSRQKQLNVNGTICTIINSKSIHIKNKNKISFIPINYSFYTESLKYNTFYNRKMYIDINGNFSNSIITDDNFGNIYSAYKLNTLKKIILSEKFQKYWKVNKNLCDVCLKCEFKHMCIDNRIPNKRKENEWYFLKECNYNPFIGKWKGEEDYKTLEECGVISNEKEYSIDHKKIAKINKQIWGVE